MKKHVFAAIAAALLCTSAHADIPAQYDSDKQTAIASLNKHLKQECINNFLEKNRIAHISPMGQLSFNETMSRAVYKSFYWNHADRGVAFSVPVKMQLAGKERVRNLACFYGMTDKGLKFQSSQQVFGAFSSN